MFMLLRNGLILITELLLLLVVRYIGFGRYHQALWIHSVSVHANCIV